MDQEPCQVSYRYIGNFPDIIPEKNEEPGW